MFVICTAVVDLEFLSAQERDLISTVSLLARDSCQLYNLKYMDNEGLFIQNRLGD